ncbi:MAG: DegV family EDD domain-containing protein [Clostridium sp.]|nr:DegV family EDD domain-containing protein [Clostridium sp.]
MELRNITSDDIYNAFLYGASEVVSSTQHLNKINVFPIQDGDTGNNLSSMMKTMINESTKKESVKETLESFSDAAIRGARGNSGIIFAQYLNGLSTEMSESREIDYNHYADASRKAVDYAYDSIDQPVEGTMLTVMKEWGRALNRDNELLSSITDGMSYAVEKVNEALLKTQYQLVELKRAKVVDAGAKGFTLFIEGITDYFKTGNKIKLSAVNREDIDMVAIDINHDINSEITYRYCTECLLEGENLDRKELKNKLKGLGDSLVVAGNKRVSRIHIHTNDPAKAFEILHKEGRIAHQKVDDMKKQHDVVVNRKSDIAILTDSIADIPLDFIDENQIHVINLNILFRDISFIDKITITPKKLLEYSKNDSFLPTSSQPDEKQIENVLSYLASYYKSVIVITVSKALSGTHSIISRVAKKLDLKDFKIDIIDSKQNSGAEGLLVATAADLLNEGLSHDEIVAEIEKRVARSKILVKVKTLDNMIKSGRLSTRAGKIGKKIGLRPVVTLDENGDGGLDSFAFTEKGSLNQIKKHVKKKMKTNTIETYNIVHVNNLEEAKDFEIIFEDIIGMKPKYITEASSVIAVGAGDKVVALSYILED